MIVKLPISRNKKAGFTLIELLVAMTIVAILTGISLVSLDGARKASRDSRRKADLEQIRSALEIYRNDCRQYPPTVTFGATLIGDDEITACAGSTYMREIPTDPVAPAGAYYYNRVSLNDYILCAYLESGGDTSAGGCETQCGGGICNYATHGP